MEKTPIEINAKMFKTLESYAKVIGVPTINYIETILGDHIRSVEGDPIQLFEELEKDDLLELIHKRVIPSEHY